MSTTRAEATDRTTSKQRRVAEQTARIETARRRQRRQRALWVGAIVVVLLAISIGAILLLSRPTVAAQGHQVPIEGNRQHVAQGSDMAYHNRPPSSGDHYPTPSGYGVFAREQQLGNLVHTLEHGGIVVYYRPDRCNDACVGQLKQAHDSAPKSREFGVVKMVVTPWQDMDYAIVAAAWGWVDEMDAPDPARIIAFYQAHVDRGPEDAL
jgi:uncharacterized protein DUF3105